VSRAKTLNSKLELAAQRAVERTLGDVASDDPPQDLTDEEARDALRRIDGADTARFRLSRTSGPHEERGVICHLSIDELDPVAIGERFGAGDYQVIAIDDNGKYITGTSRRVHVSRSVARRAQAGDTERPAPAARPANGGTDYAELVRFVAPHVATVIAAWIARPAPQPVDVVALIAAMNAGKSGGGLDEMVKSLAALDQLRSRGGGDTGIIDAALKLADRLREAPGDSDSWVSVLKEFAPAAMAILQAKRGQIQGSALAPGQQSAPVARVQGPPSSPLAQARPPQVPGSVPPSPASSQAPQPSPPGSPPSTTMNGAPEGHSPPASSSGPGAPSLSAPSISNGAGNGAPEVNLQERVMLEAATPWLRLQATNCQAWAMSQMDPELASETLVASLPPMFARAVPPAQFIEWLTRADWWDVLVMFHPPIAEYRAWCDEVRQELVAFFSEELEEDKRAPAAEEPAPAAANGGAA